MSLSFFPYLFYFSYKVFKFLHIIFVGKYYATDVGHANTKVFCFLHYIVGYTIIWENKARHNH